MRTSNLPAASSQCRRHSASKRSLSLSSEPSRRTRSTSTTVVLVLYCFSRAESQKRTSPSLLSPAKKYKTRSSPSSQGFPPAAAAPVPAAEDEAAAAGGTILFEQRSAG